MSGSQSRSTKVSIIEKPRGTRDFSHRETQRRDYVEDVISKVFESYYYKKIITPTFEHVELFRLKSGEEITEHMFIFKDKSNRELCLRPEATASVCRMFSEELQMIQRPLKLYYFCPMFRYDEPQKGRYREFWQIGVELIGAGSPESDAEVIAIASESLGRLGLKFKLEINHLGILRGFLNDLDAKDKTQDRVLALVDRKNFEELRKTVDNEKFFELIKLNGGKDILESANSILKGYPTAAKALEDLREVILWLDAMNVDYIINPGIARGLAYYTGTVFEIRVPDLGAQNQICGGGRYDELIGMLSGVKTPAVGFAFGFDRIMNAIEFQGIEIPEKKADVVVAPASADARIDAAKIASKLREKFIVDFDLMNRKLGRILEYAGNIGAGYAVIVGPEDLKNRSATVRNMKTGEQKTVKIDDIVKEIG